MGMGGAMELVFKAILDRSNVASGLKAIEGQVQTFTQKMKNMGVMGAVGTELSALGKSGGGALQTLGALAGVGASIGAGFGVAMQAVSGLTGVLKAGLIEFDKFQEATLEIARFTGSMKMAKEKMEEFDNLGEELSTGDEQLAGAYRILRLIGGEAMATSDNIRMIADASAAGRGGVEELARSFAIVSASIESGEGTGRFGMQLARMGVISFDAKEAIDSLAKAGGKTSEAMAILTKEFGKFAGSAEAKGRTLSGAMVNLKDSVGDLFKSLAQPISGTLANIIRDSADAIKEFEPLAKVLGTLLNGVLLIVNGLTTGFMNFLDIAKAVGNFGDDASFLEGMEKAMERVEKRTANLKRELARNPTTGMVDGEDKVAQTEVDAKYDFDEGAEKNSEKIAKLNKEILEIKKKTAELSMTEGEKLKALEEERKAKIAEIEEAEKRKAEAALKGTAGASANEAIVLNLKKEQLAIELEMAQIAEKERQAKLKAAEDEKKKTEEIRDRIKDGREKREFSKSNTNQKLELNAQERARLSAEKAQILGEQGGDTPENNRKIAEIDEKLANNAYQREDIVNERDTDFAKAKSETQSYNDKKLLDGLRQEFGNPEDNKKAIELEKELHKTRIKQLEEQAKKQEQAGDLGGAERSRLEAQKEQDMISGLSADKRLAPGSRGAEPMQAAGSLGGSLLGIQTGANEAMVKPLQSIEQLTKMQADTIKQVADNTGKPIVITSFT